MHVTSISQLAAVMGVGMLLAAPADAQMDFDVERARSECVRTLAGCNAAAEKAQGMLVFPRVSERSGTPGAHGEGALLVSNKIEGYYSIAAAASGLQLGVGETYSQILIFTTPAALASFRNSPGWEVGANAKVTMIDQGNAADINAIIANSPVVAFVFGRQGLMGDLSLDGAKITRLGS
jgi:lipid-binding SYLF domain-containing protein